LAEPTSFAIKFALRTFANIIQKSLICPVDKSGFFVGAGNGNQNPQFAKALQAPLFRASELQGAILLRKILRARFGKPF
jgi:hypothetical protein